MVVGAMKCIGGLHTHFPPHEPYIVANDCEYFTEGYSCAIDDAVE